MSTTMKADEFFKNVIRAARWRLTLESSHQEEGIKVELAGEDAPLLLAHNGEVLRALEYLANRVFEKGGQKIIVDCNDFHAQREEELRLMAQVAAERVKRLGKPHAFSPMSPEERRIIHLAVADEPGIRTESEGFGENRKVVMYPQ
jgi:spoIIIJ-associated protein